MRLFDVPTLKLSEIFCYMFESDSFCPLFSALLYHFLVSAFHKRSALCSLYNYAYTSTCGPPFANTWWHYVGSFRMRRTYTSFSDSNDRNEREREKTAIPFGSVITMAAGERTRARHKQNEIRFSPFDFVLSSLRPPLRRLRSLASHRRIRLASVKRTCTLRLTLVNAFDSHSEQRNKRRRKIAYVSKFLSSAFRLRSVFSFIF